MFHGSLLFIKDLDSFFKYKSFLWEQIPRWKPYNGNLRKVPINGVFSAEEV
jgi:hypothetical protein